MLSLTKSRLSGKILFFIFIFILLFSCLYSTIINVPTPYTTIQAGITAAVNGDTVLVQPGTYYENINYNGKLITVGSLFLTTLDTTYISSTIIDGNSTNSVVKIESGEDSTAVLCGFTITNGSLFGGGGINCYGSTPTLRYLLITGNSANYGGGVWIYDASPSLENVTITGNTASVEGGGISCSFNSNPVLINSIHWNNSPQDIYISTSSITVIYSDIQGGWTGTGNIDSDPLFVNPVIGDYHLQSTSPCIDAGDPASPLDPDGSIADMGAFYFFYLIPPEADFTTDIITGNSPLTVNFTDISTPGAGVIDEWYWDFGDGNNSSLQNPANEYLLPGNYTVSLTVTDVNDSTDTETKVDYITVDTPLYSGPVWYISTTGSDVTGNGSEQYPFATIQHGITISSNTDIILVQPGTYVENINFNGKLITVGSLYFTTQDTSYILSTIIDGDSIDSVVTFESGEDSTAVLSGFTITNGSLSTGGGIKCINSSSPNLQHLAISGNSADIGGGLYCNASHPSLSNINISDNSVSGTYGYGGGILCENSSNPSFEDVTISTNSADYGGGIFCWYSIPSLLNVTISGNSADSLGGGIYCHNYSSPSLQNVTISDNSANDGAGIACTYASDPDIQDVAIIDNTAINKGGGIFSVGSYPSFENVTVSGNSADRGGGCYIEASSPSFENVIITNNLASGTYGYGGGLYCYDSYNPTLHNVTISGNNADYGGGFFCYDADPTLDKVTITGNTASTEGGGIYNGWASDPILINSILWNDSPQEILIGGGSVTATYSDIEGGFTGTGNIDSDPLFVDPGSGDYHLQAASPCINTGNPDPLYFDPDGTVADMGAYFFNQYNGPIWHVSKAGSDETGSGSEQYPFSTIQNGINFSSNTDTVLVQPGTYVENINFNGKLITVGSLFLTTQDTTYISSTIIDGNSSGSVVTFESGEDSTAVLSGFTITNGSYNTGGGIHCENSSNPSLNNLSIVNNSSTGHGGGIYCWNSNPILENITISGNSTVHYGGGIFCYWNSSPSIKNVTITDNSANYGGGINCYTTSDPSLENVTISGNTASVFGGGIYCYDSSPSLINTILWNDSPQEIYIGTGSVTVTYSDIEGSWTGTGNIDSDPLFVDPVSGDYHLQPESPCVDAGDPAFPLDPDGSIIEMGAYYCPQFIGAEFAADSTNGCFPLTVNFTDLSTPGTGVIDEWYWDFGDGNNSSLQNPTNEYSLIGYYTVSLTVTNDLDSTSMETKVDYIEVTPPAYDGPVWNISATGSDTHGNGSTQYPFATIQYGINYSSDTDTVLVQPGTYVENINYNGKLITVGSLFLTTMDTTYISQTIVDGDTLGSVITFENSEDSTAVLSGFTITNGLATYYGGGIYCYESSPSLQNVIITANSASGIFASGGGIYCYESSPSLQNVTISGNSAKYGGGISCSSNSNPSIQNVTITSNIATVGSGGYGGGGIACSSSSHPNLVNVTITGNSAVDSGGGIHLDYTSNPTFKNVTIVDNSANNGGGIYCWENCSPSLENVTISENTAVEHGGGIYSRGNSNPGLSNSILWNNSPEEIYNIYGGSTTATYSDIEGGWTGTGNIDSDPLFADPGSGNYHLQSISPCIDAGDPAAPLDPDGTIADMGAHYYHQYAGPVWHISTTGSDLSGNGTEQLPFATIQHGIDVSSNTDTVLVYPGTYIENINYNGKLITVGSLFFTAQDTTYISSTIMDGNSSGSVVTFESGEDSTAILSGFTITNGLNSGGGGIHCENSSSPSLNNLSIINNSSTGHGGGIYCWNSNPFIENITITDNSAVHYGGGIFCYSNSSPSIKNVTISNNSASIGGGIHCHTDANPVLTNSILWDNSPQEIYIQSGSVTATYSDIEGGWTGTGNIDSDPLFVDPTNGDYHLSWANFPIRDGTMSPCIDAGDQALPFEPDGTITDIGAFYYHQNSGPLWHISTTGSDLTGNGTDLYPFATIQKGINYSADADTVLVQPGTYVENINYNGKLIKVGSLFLTTQDTTYISSTTIDGNNSGRVVTFEYGEDSTAVLCGITLTNGLASGDPPGNCGGGIYCYESNPSLQNITISGNTADYGGGVLCEMSSPSLENITITGNSATYSGGGIYFYDNSSPSLENVTITGNSANRGGGILCYYYSSPSLENVTISGNIASEDGGGIYCQDSSLNLINSILWNDSPQEIYIVSGGIVTAIYSNIYGGWTGTGNIDEDPLFVDPGNGNYHLQSTSPCIDAGDPASPLDPDSTVADMGAYYFHQITALDPPQNVTIVIIGTDVHLSWDAVTGANSYKIYSSDDPYTGFVEDTSGSFAGESWSAPIGDVKKFYHVTASTETIRSKDSDSQDAYHPDRKSRRYEPDKFINRKRK